MDSETDQYVADDVGICDRKNKCGYHRPPREHFAENQADWQTGLQTKWNRGERNLQFRTSPESAKPTPDFIDNDRLIRSLADYERNSFVRFLSSVYIDRPDAVRSVLRDYFIGTWDNGSVVFWQVDQQLRIRTGKVMWYDPATGKRIKDQNPTWIHAILKKRGELAETFRMQQCYFGEHLLANADSRPVAVVEAEKTAVVAAVSDLEPDITWVACGSLTNLSVEGLQRIGRNRSVRLFPDADAFERWDAIAKDARSLGLNVAVSTLLETRLSAEEKAHGYDLADFLIESKKRTIAISC